MKNLKLSVVKSMIKVFYFLLFTVVIIPANMVISQEESEGMKLFRQAWFETQRYYPYDTIQGTNLINALDFQQTERENNNYYFAPNVAVWTSIGPTPYYQDGVPHTGRVMTVKYSPSNPNVLYIAGHNGGLWKSTNAQSSWQDVIFTPKTDNFQTQSSGAIAVAQYNSNIIYYATGGGMYFAINYPGVGVYRSTNGGENWSGPYRLMLNGSPILTHSFNLAIYPYNPNVVYLAETSGLWMSINGGINWTRTIPSSGTTPKHCCDVEIGDHGFDFDPWIYAVGPRPDWVPAPWLGNEYNGIGYWLSTNGGANFFQPQNCGFIPADRSHIAVSKTNPYKVYAVTIQGGVKAYRSINGGLNFTNEVVLINRNSMANSMIFLQVSPLNSDVAWVGFGDGYTCVSPDGKYHLFRTTNGGINYEAICSPYADQTNLDFHPTDQNQIMLSNDGGVWRCNNAMAPVSQITFESLSKTLSFSLTFRVTSNPYNPQDILTGQTDNGFLKKDYNQLTWTSRMSCCDGTNILYSKSIQGLILGSTGVNMSGFAYTLWNSTNNGVTFGSHYVPGFADGDVEWIRPIIEHPNIAGTFFTVRRQAAPNSHKISLLISIDRGNSWQVVLNSSPIITGGSDNVPNLLCIQENNPQIMYVATNSRISPSEVYKTTDGGGSWNSLSIHNNGVPDRFVTSVVTDPCNQNINYLSLSGYGTEHIFKSTNGGLTWFQISNPNAPYQTSTALPSIPVNFLMVRYITLTQKQLIAATDAGVYQSIDDDSRSWGELANGLPNTISLGLNHNLLAGKLLASTWGRGVFQTNLPGKIYVPCKQILNSDATTSGLEVSDDIVVGPGAVLEVPNTCTIKMPADKKIIIEDGGQIDVSSGATVTITSQSGSWGGIEFEGETNSGNLKNITFSNTNTPITITGGESLQYNGVKIENCTFNDGPISIDSRGNVEVKNCTFNYSGSYDPLVQGVSSVGSDDITIQGNTINSNASLTGTSISVVYGNSIFIVDNTIYNAYNGISISNSDPYVAGNTISHSSPSYSNDGIGLDNCNSPTFNSNTVTGYVTGFKLGNSSPVMLSNSTENSGATYSMLAENESNARLAPLQGDGELIYDAGFNSFSTDNNNLYISHRSIPVLDLGCNSFTANQNGYYIEGSIDDGMFTEYYATHNVWDYTPSQQKYNINGGNVIVIYDPSGCDQPGGGGLDPIANPAKEKEVVIPQPIIVDRGNGFYDTIQVTNHSFSVSQDRILFAQGTKQELLGNYQNAVSIFAQLIQSYPHTQSAIKALGSILLCYDKSQADSSNYATLRNHYYNLLQSHNNDTAFSRTVRNLAAKTLVKMKLFPSAITEYENIISNSNDSLEIFFAELSIIETYMLIHQQGDAPSFTGRLSYLKPNNIADGLRMLKEKYYNSNKNKFTHVIPKEFSLAQNYPNPFNPITTINYSLPQNTKVVIKVYDILGRLVKEIVNEHKAAGVYKIKFDGTNLSSGIYFYKIEAGTFVDTKKMVLVK